MFFFVSNMHPSQCGLSLAVIREYTAGHGDVLLWSFSVSKPEPWIHLFANKSKNQWESLDFEERRKPHGG